MKTSWTTPDICDFYGEQARVFAPIFQSFGGKTRFCGPVSTVQCFEDNSKVKSLAAEAGHGRVMVVDGGASLRRALLGDQIAQTAADNGWAGFVINGCVRDVEILRTLALGILALNAIPVKTEKRDRGEVDCPLAFAGVIVEPGQYLYADESGLVLLNMSL